jgi:starch synthase (maltosyl-transferring)
MSAHPRESPQGKTPARTARSTARADNLRSAKAVPAPKPAAAGDGRRRVVIEAVSPSVDGGRFPVKRVIGDQLVVEADAFVDGHDALRCLLRWRRVVEASPRARRAPGYTEVEMHPLGNDRWRASFQVDELGEYEYTVAAWVDHFRTWRHDVKRWVDPEDVATSLQVGATILSDIAARAGRDDARELLRWRDRLLGNEPLEQRHVLAQDDALGLIADRHPDRRFETTAGQLLRVRVDPVVARFGAWYELFPRSVRGDGRHGTLADVEAVLPDIASMGFDVLYLPPIHPIGVTRRKGPNNTLTAGPGDPGSPWAIGAAEGGHKSVLPELGSEADLVRLARRARELDIELALDVAFQASPDHPYVGEHPDWFRHRPDGSIQYAENPPKKYQDIYPFNFESDDWQALWTELEDVFRHWIACGVRVFRVDNPHTKPFPMWEWMIGRIKRDHPDTIFLAEAFTRPKVMHRLAKLGFSQSYTYFAWRNGRDELEAYFTELAQSPSREYFRPNVWPNTPDILTEYLQEGGRPAFMVRIVLATTLAAAYGIYGPAFELCERRPREPGSEEYRDSEKYEIRRWDLGDPDSLRPLVATLNAIRRENPALHDDWRLHFHRTDNEHLICYSKSTPDLDNVVLCIVNLDWRWTHAGWVELDLAALGVAPDLPFIVEDLVSGERYPWQGARNYVELSPKRQPFHVLRIRQAAEIDRAPG